MRFSLAAWTPGMMHVSGPKSVHFHILTYVLSRYFLSAVYHILSVDSESPPDHLPGVLVLAAWTPGMMQKGQGPKSELFDVLTYVLGHYFLSVVYHTLSVDFGSLHDRLRVVSTLKARTPGMMLVSGPGSGHP